MFRILKTTHREPVRAFIVVVLRINVTIVEEESIGFIRTIRRRRPISSLVTRTVEIEITVVTTTSRRQT
jgi:hypothetical protein